MVADPAAFRPDPHAGFARYRPLAGIIDLGGAMPFVTRLADVTALIVDPRTRQIETEPLTARGITSGALHGFYANSMLLSNPPAHARRRAPVVRAFASRLVQAWRPHIRALVGDMVDAVAAAGEAEFQAAFASPLPSRVIAAILGAADADASDFAAKVYGMSKGLGGFRDADYEAIEAATAGLIAHVERLLEDRRRAPRDDFLTDYLRRVEEVGSLSATETLIQVVSLIIGGSDTTRFGLTAAVSLLLQHREQWEALCRDPGLAPAAVNEALRFEPPVGAIGRVVAERLSVDGVALEPGTVFSVSILSAQRDEAAFADPQRFDIARTDHPRLHASFGFGPHRCLGEALARAEMEEALVVLTQRLPGLALAGAPPLPKGHSGMRGIGPMQVRWA
jgi:hypothetical protein